MIKEFRDVLLNRKLSTERMRKLNYEVEVNKKLVKEVAREFVEELKYRE